MTNYGELTLTGDGLRVARVVGVSSLGLTELFTYHDECSHHAFCFVSQCARHFRLNSSRVDPFIITDVRDPYIQQWSPWHPTCLFDPFSCADFF